MHNSLKLEETSGFFPCAISPYDFSLSFLEERSNAFFESAPQRRALISKASLIDFPNRIIDIYFSNNCNPSNTTFGLSLQFCSACLVQTCCLIDLTTTKKTILTCEKRRSSHSRSKIIQKLNEKAWVSNLDSFQKKKKKTRWQIKQRGRN